ncbi:hypothetical protein [Salirhabdus salicampi]|uniref:hypothetical protein n=1 Tax=Salirhabdus salicampi TaxID=476102 RepID=UPI0020C55727|nr:hypothetical protein [Salirhabdus salicampi]MCP8617076.1 hypothetical protein [Salirhabdus salicampi]
MANHNPPVTNNGQSYRCCIYRNINSGRFTKLCTPIKTSNQIGCRMRPNYQIVFASHGPTIDCEDCEAIVRGLNAIN